MRAFLTLAVGAVAVGFWVYAVVDCSLTDARRIRGLPKPAWIVITIVLSIIGGALWFLVGKNRAENAGLGRVHGAPDDDPVFLRRIASDADQDERIRRLEQEIAELDDDSKDS